MPFYSTDNLTTYIFTAIEENFDSLDYQGRIDEKKNLISMLSYNMCDFKMYCCDYVTPYASMDTPFFQAVMRSIDWDTLRDYLNEWLEDADVGESEDEAETEAKYQQTKAEIVAKMDEMKRLITEKNDDEMDALTDPKNH
jgi:hypothetical protein